jgi:mRNA interferase HigB
MRGITPKRLAQFAAERPAARAPLAMWRRVTERALWRSFADVRRTFGRTDQVRVSSGNTLLVFNIGGNKFRLVAKVSYEKGKVYVFRVMTHKEYDTGRWKEEL